MACACMSAGDTQDMIGGGVRGDLPPLGGLSELEALVERLLLGELGRLLRGDNIKVELLGEADAGWRWRLGPGPGPGSSSSGPVGSLRGVAVRGLRGAGGSGKEAMVGAGESLVT
jgi:hypothetical protein